MKSPEISKLCEEYLQAANAQLTEEQFGTLVMFFPALSVISSDGKVDDEEWIYVKYLAKFMADTYKDEPDSDSETLAALSANYLQQLEFILQNMSYWSKAFIEVLSSYLAQNPDFKEDVIDTLYLFAEASEGESEDEAKQIAYLKTVLGLV